MVDEKMAVVTDGAAAFLVLNLRACSAFVDDLTAASTH
jgi:hypothetical protein